MKRGALRTLFLLVAVGGALAAAACSLNPQPIPPGEQPDGGNQDFGSGTGGSSDADTNTPTPGDSGVGRDDDGGDAGETDASDAGSDDAGDAEADADAT